MAKHFGRVESYKLKELIFVLAALIILLLALAFFFFSELIQIYILVGFFAIFLVFLVSRYDFLLTLKEYERAVIFRFGHAKRVGGPGWTLIWPVIESSRLVDLRTQTIDVKPQEVITKDKVVVQIDAIIYLVLRKLSMRKMLARRNFRRPLKRLLGASHASLHCGQIKIAADEDSDFNLPA